ncbi:glycosyltransferase [Candidatus Gottesmanbacteria bacterium]|nr:glycosyltransferase [Candidatus Gottesmanbacteria bacterium]
MPLNETIPLISVVIPTLNEEKYLSLCLKSLKNQTFQNFEVIISDGGSTDKTKKIASKYGVRIVAHPNITVTLARQSGIDIARGEIIVGADADTIYPQNHLEKIVKDFKEKNTRVAVGGGGVFEKHPLWLHLGWKIAYALLALLSSIFKTAIYIPAFNLSFKKEAFKRIDGYKTYLDFGGDELDILNRLRKRGEVYFDKNLICYPSSRRAKGGFFSIIVKHTLIDYYLNYFLAKIYKKPIIKGKPIR